MFMKEPHTALFVALTGVGKIHLALSLLENEYRNHFDFVVIICPTLAHNEMYKSRGWVWNDPDVILIEPVNNLYYLIDKISNLLTGSATLFLIDDIIADEALDNRRQPLLGLAISGRHRQHSLWLLNQLYTAIPNNIRRQAKSLTSGAGKFLGIPEKILGKSWEFFPRNLLGFLGFHANEEAGKMSNPSFPRSWENDYNREYLSTFPRKPGKAWI